MLMVNVWVAYKIYTVPRMALAQISIERGILNNAHCLVVAVGGESVVDCEDDALTDSDAEALAAADESSEALVVAWVCAHTYANFGIVRKQTY